jgi:hypothetical protein
MVPLTRLRRLEAAHCAAASLSTELLTAPVHHEGSFSVVVLARAAVDRIRLTRGQQQTRRTGSGMREGMRQR